MNTSQAQQFASLQRATSAYHNDAKVADQMRIRETETMNRAIDRNRRDEEKLRIAHGELGEETRKAKNLSIERERIKNAMESDRQSIIRITSELKGIEASYVVVIRRSSLLGYNRFFFFFMNSICALWGDQSHGHTSRP